MADGGDGAGHHRVPVEPDGGVVAFFSGQGVDERLPGRVGGARLDEEPEHRQPAGRAAMDEMQLQRGGPPRDGMLAGAVEVDLEELEVGTVQLRKDPPAAFACTVWPVSTISAVPA